MIKRLFSLLAASLILILIILVQTPFGLQCLFDSLRPFHLLITVQSGSLFKPMMLTQIRYETTDSLITIDQADIQSHIIRFHPLQIAVPAIQIHQLMIRNKHSGSPDYAIEHLQASGQWLLKNNNDKTAFNIEWQNMNIPISDTFNISLPQGKLHLTGPLSDYTAQGTFTSEGQHFLKAMWQIQTPHGSLNAVNDLHLTAFAAKFPQNKIHIKGDVAWLPVTKWHALLSAQHIDLSTLYPPLEEGHINLDLLSQGEITETDADYGFQIKDLNGLIHHLPMQGQGQVKIHNTDYTIQALNIHLGKAVLQLNGHHSPQSALLNFNTNIPALDDILPALHGQITAQGQVSLDKGVPYIQTRIQLTQIKTPFFSAAHANGLIQLHLNTIAKTQIALNIKTATIKAYPIETAQLNIDNTQRKNHLVLSLSSSQGQLHLVAQGSFHNKAWQGNINTFTVNVPSLGNLALSAPIRLALSEHHLRLQPFCLRASIGETCIQKAYVESPLTTQKEPRLLKGQLTFSSHDLNFLSLVWPQLTNIKGLLSGDIHLAGSTVAPLVSGQLSLDQAEMKIPSLGLYIQQIGVKILSKNNTLTYQATLSSGKGRATIKGQTNLKASGFPTHLNIQSTPLLVMNTPDFIVYAQPALTIDFLSPLLTVKGKINIPEATLTPRDLTSAVTLPREVVFEDGNNEKNKPSLLDINSRIAVTVGPAVKLRYAGLMGEITGALILAQKPGGDATGSGVLNLVNGQYKAYGQNLAIKQGKLVFTGGPVTNPGLSIQAIKQLQIVSTSNSSTTTTHTNTQQVVGIQITGTASNPNTRLFSEPAGLSQADILSYLVLGRPSSQASQKDSASLASALSLLNLGDENSGQLKKQLSQALGLSELSVGSQETYDKNSNETVQNTSLLLGKTLSPNLTIHYSLGLIEPVNTLQLMYQLTKNLRLQSEHSTNANGVDIYYVIERK